MKKNHQHKQRKQRQTTRTRTKPITYKISTFRDKYLCNYKNDIVFCGSPHIKIMNNGFALHETKKKMSLTTTFEKYSVHRVSDK